MDDVPVSKELKGGLPTILYATETLRAQWSKELIIYMTSI